MIANIISKIEITNKKLTFFQWLTKKEGLMQYSTHKALPIYGIDIIDLIFQTHRRENDQVALNSPSYLQNQTPFAVMVSTVPTADFDVFLILPEQFQQIIHL